MAALDSLAATETPCGFVYGGGFEDRPALLEDIAERFPLFGNVPEVVRRVKDPARLAELCAALKIPHPEISLDVPGDRQNWLVKRAGGAGGSHIALASVSPVAADEALYFQRIAAGEPVSILFVANGAKAQIVGLSRQWAAPALEEPFRFGGSVRPADLTPALEGRLCEAAQAVTAACGLKGLNSIDCLVDGADFTLIEINPRPGATLDIFEDHGGSLFGAHVEACRGRLPARPLDFEGAAAAAIAYAPWDISSMPDVDWPEWISDRQKAYTGVPAQAPLCTVKAKAADPGEARALLDERMGWLFGKLQGIASETIATETMVMGKETAH